VPASAKLWVIPRNPRSHQSKSLSKELAAKGGQHNPFAMGGKPKWWFGIQTEGNAFHVTKDSEAADEVCKSHGSPIVALLPSKATAEAWLNTTESLKGARNPKSASKPRPADEDDNGSTPPSSTSSAEDPLKEKLLKKKDKKKKKMQKKRLKNFRM
jgi:hypothetical protein